MAPKILLATTCRWFSTARLALAFRRVGCVVDAVCPSGHPVLATRAVENNYGYNALTPIHSYREAILSSWPDLIVPCDDLAVKHLHSLYERTGEDSLDSSTLIRWVMEASLGDPCGHPITGSRDNFMAMVYAEGIRAPETKAVSSEQEVKEWLQRFGFPAVLKADGTSGGEGVRIVETREEALRAYRSLRAPVEGLVAAKRACIDRDWNSVMPWLTRRQRMVSIQAFVDGPDANLAACCWQGKILSSIAVEVLETWRPKGPATMVRVIENSEMQRAAEKIVRRLNFSGLCGFDFLLDRGTGGAFLIEMNARATQTCHLPLDHGRDLVAALSWRLNRQAACRMPIDLRGDTIALFPLAWNGDTESDRFLCSYHDIPWEEPELVRWGMKQIKKRPHERWTRLFQEIGLYQP